MKLSGHIPKKKAPLEYWDSVETRRRICEVIRSRRESIKRTIEILKGRE